MKKFIIAVLLFAACQPAPKPAAPAAAAAPDSTTLSPTDKGFAAVNGLNMYYEVYGDGKPIVLLHGAYMTIPLNWSRVIPEMARKRKVIVAEMQSHGRTKDIDRPITYEGMADDVSGLLKHLKIDSADVMGYSMGGGIAYQLAIRHPEQVRRLIVLSGTYTNDGWWPDVEKSFASITPDMFRGTAIEKQYDSLGNDPAHFDDYVKKIISMDLKPYNWTKEVKNIQAPIFLAIGDADGVRYEHALDLYKAKGGGKMGDMYGLPKSRVAIIPGTTHIGMMEHIDWIMPMVDDFLDSDLSTKPPTF
ncbi:Pimeloyl-ACP methyl ester carboxylesterase [Chitinophaga jiangningensis]|uniref:Pimeloyl-ACP methyl ester carboxylesterase n=1 Tax=Chitinophaga jiangningensis TaxID=1419482 RepID=A0A1M7MB53_9BACT|nr:alpha/beta hydrolase [Chitinophaga jiangningensis]SHM87542.1 Pimeloyl-ACP methyl ester carboxylesterase [Chitinophaga jiangningensis]